MTEWIDYSFDNGIAEGNKDDDEDGHKEVISGSIVVS
jgi:hypothetical protein